DQKLSGEVDLFVYIDKNLYKNDIRRLFNGFRLWNEYPPATEDSSYLNEFKMNYVKVVNPDFEASGSRLALYNNNLTPSKVNVPATYSPVNGKYLTQESETGAYSYYSGLQEKDIVTQRVIDRDMPKNVTVLYD